VLALLFDFFIDFRLLSTVGAVGKLRFEINGDIFAFLSLSSPDLRLISEMAPKGTGWCCVSIFFWSFFIF
jgi:hypothetical protein